MNINCYNKIKAGDWIEIGWSWSSGNQPIRISHALSFRKFEVRMGNRTHRPMIDDNGQHWYIYSYEIKRIIKKSNDVLLQ